MVFVRLGNHFFLKYDAKKHRIGVNYVNYVKFIYSLGGRTILYFAMRLGETIV